MRARPPAPRAPAPALARRAAPVGVLLSALLALAGCGLVDPAPSVSLRAPEAPRADDLVARWVGDLVGGDAEASAAAERQLLALDREGRAALEAHAARIPGERDPRWIHVLEEQGLLPALTPGERVAFWLWKVRRPETSFAMKAQAALGEQARRDPAPLLAELARGGDATAPVAAALAVAGRRDAVPALCARYLAASDDDERRPLTEALAVLLGEDARPRLGGRPEERARDAEAALARWRELEGGRP